MKNLIIMFIYQYRGNYMNSEKNYSMLNDFENDNVILPVFAVNTSSGEIVLLNNREGDVVYFIGLLSGKGRNKIWDFHYLNKVQRDYVLNIIKFRD